MESKSTKPAEPESRAFKPLHEMLRDEIARAESELRRPLLDLVLSAASAGFAIGTSILLILTARTYLAESADGVAAQLLTASFYAIGFVIVILGRMDLFTEFTTIAVLPVMRRRAGLAPLGRFWAVIYAGNLGGAALFAAVLTALGPALGIIEQSAAAQYVQPRMEHAWWTLVLSAGVAGYLMGLLSWLIVGGRETISRIAFVALIAFVIGFCHLHHSVVGAVAAFAAAMTADGITIRGLAGYLGLITIGNAGGGIIFAASIHFSVAEAGRHHY